jgi:cobalt/nickel transport system permease protein
MQHSFLDSLSRVDSPLRRLDPRAKLAGLLVFIVLCVTTPPDRYWAFAAYLGLELLLLAISRLPWRHVARRMLVVLPFVMVVAVFLPFFQKGGGSYNLGPLSVSGHGLMVLWNVAAKSTLSVLAVILLSSTTPFPDLVKGMRRLRLPELLTSLLSFTYRYIFVLTDEVQRMRRARDSRGWSGRWLWQARTIGHMVATLFLRSYERGERVYAAMLARGYDGSLPLIYDYAFREAEWAFVGLVVLFPLAARVLSYGMS